MQIVLVFPHQLFSNHPCLDRLCHVVLVEEYLFFNQYKFHKQKILLHRASMRWYYDQLIKAGHQVQYIESHQIESDIRILIPWLHAQGYTEFALADPHDYLLERRLRRFIHKTKTRLLVSDSPGFLLNRVDIETWFGDKKRLFQTEFYISQRKRFGVLIDQNQQPIGGKWSFDVENRKKYPIGKQPPLVHYPPSNAYQVEAAAYVERYFHDNPGSIKQVSLYPTDTEQSNAWLKQFLELRFDGFGTYEDAMMYQEAILNHSLLTPVLNIGLTTPTHVIQTVLKHAGTSQFSHQPPHSSVHLPDLEGFLRQIMGWREFIRAVYATKGVAERTCNFWNFHRKIPLSFYTGQTGIVPIDTVIKRVLETGYCHHIERLMVLGNFMLLCEFDPDEVYRWFMELFVDSYDWVMVPNVYGMSQYADGGLMATKPYLSGSNYLLKMGDWSGGAWQKVWDGLFWRFMHVHRKFFLRNPRLAMLVRSFDKMPVEKQQALLHEADQFLAGLELS